MYFDHVAAIVPAPEQVAALHAKLARERAAPEVQQVAKWAVASQDHAGMPFVVVDKTQARLFAFDPQGRLLGSTRILWGIPRGEPATATTPTGRFVADTWLSAHTDGVVWVNAGAALAVYATPHAAGGLDSQIPEGHDQPPPDGTLRVAGDFYREHLSTLKGQLSVAYVLSQGQPWQEVIGSHAPAIPRPQFTFAQRRAQPLRSPS